ncbi:AAA family ATPase [Saccharopolyspora sp. K220]|uniref:helix-turn-helix transcriptional regulator n=1 Tax=Saccharopolyspora soli TaxID=2926618 RepID=UPI001F58FFF1|nr:LuxR family transcriptional regulator [Saccharopolyspora soli]MCI2422401.1 AAA family ATPase [Saccharopolyspora soli]
MSPLDPAGPEHASESLVGRAEDLASIVSFFDEAAVQGGALLLSGEAGVGKTALLNAVAEAASRKGTRILRAAGVEFEVNVSYSGLNQLFFPLHDSIGALGDAHRDALRVALGFGTGPPPDRLLVSNAALLLVRMAASEMPLLLIVDDLPWLDRASAAVLGFVARRLVGSRVGLLAASRSQTGSYFDPGGLPYHEVRPLDDAAATELINDRFPDLASQVRRRLLIEARGNPLALLELPAALSESQLSASAALPPLLPLSQRLQTLFASRMAKLPASSRKLLLLAALDGTGDLDVLRAAAAGQYDLDDLAPAERDQLVRVEGTTRRVSFRHPLIGSAAVEVSTDQERRWAHRCLADALVDQPERRAWHLGEACVGPDEHVADLLEQAARGVLRRGDAVRAVASLTRAAELSPLATDRTRRRAEAAYIGADASGELSSALQLLDGACGVDPGSSGSLHAAAAAVYLLINRDGDVDTAHRLLVGAIEAGDHGYDASNNALNEALHTLLLVCWFGGRPELWEPFYAALDRLTPEVPPLLSVCSKTFPDPARTGVAAKAELDAVLSGLHNEVDPTRIVRMGTASVYLDRLADCREASWRVVRQGREGGPVRRRIGALMHLFLDGFLTGKWDQAATFADEGMRLCEEHEYRFFSWYFRYDQALLAAVRGNFDTSRALTDEIVRSAAPRGAHGAELFANHARVLADLGRGDFEDAYQHATALSPAGTLASHVPHALWATMDLVEAAVRTNRDAEAAAHVNAMREADIAALSPRLALLAGGSAAMAAADGDMRLFEEALAIPGADRWPFEAARVRLLYGERLRRARATAESRIQLRAALEIFERLGARPWAARANNELRAAGLANPKAEDPESASLTPQEREIALLAASGLTNKQIGERLFLSHRTVGAHLYRIFPKLGIASRAALRDALADLPEQPD